jgi:hypothetical protein
MNTRICLFCRELEDNCICDLNDPEFDDDELDDQECVICGEDLEECLCDGEEDTDDEYDDYDDDYPF